jgi:hypothetical protein
VSEAAERFLATEAAVSEAMRDLDADGRRDLLDRLQQLVAQLEIQVGQERGFFLDAPRVDDHEPDTFKLFWRAFPRKVGKGAAARAWTKIRPSPQLAARIVAAVETQKTWPQWMKNGGEFIPHPATWLNRGSWDDETTVAAVSPVSDIGRQNAANAGVALQMMKAGDAAGGRNLGATESTIRTHPLRGL